MAELGQEPGGRPREEWRHRHADDPARLDEIAEDPP
jgi:hypothetical protein